MKIANGPDFRGTPVYSVANLTDAAGNSLSASSGVLVFSNQSIPAGNTIANTASETFFSSVYTIPANSLAVGDVLRIYLDGYYSTTMIAPMVRGRVYMNNVVVSDSGNVTTGAGATQAGWFGRGEYLIMVVGTSGGVDSQAFLSMQSAVTTSLTVNIVNVNTIAIDTTINQTISVSVTWGTANAANTITLRQMKVEKLRVGGLSVVSGGTDGNPDQINGFLLETDRLIDTSTTANTTSQQGYFHALIATQTVSVTGISFCVNRPGSVNSGGYVTAVGLFDASGNLLAIGDASGVMGSTGWKKISFTSPYKITAGTKYVIGYVAAGNDIPGLRGVPSFSEYNQYTSGAGMRNFKKSGVTTLNTTQAFGTNTSANTSERIFFALY